MPATIDLLPRKEFRITLEDGSVISGKFGTWAQDRFCKKRNYNFEQFQAAFTSDLRFDHIIDYLLCAVENHFRELKNKESFPYNDVDAGMWIDELGGVEGAEFLRLFAHSYGEKKTEEAPESL